MERLAELWHPPASYHRFPVLFLRSGHAFSLQVSSKRRVPVISARQFMCWLVKSKIKAMLEIIVILCVALANVYPKPFWYFFWYNLLYGVACSFLVPIFLLRKEKNLFALMGFKSFGKRQFLVLVIFAGFSVGGQLIPMVAAGRAVPWDLLPMGIVPLIMTTFFEEFLFQGFCQTRIEKAFGALPAILVSGLMFSLYHLGYPGFRTLEDLMLLFAVGVGFAAAYKLSGNNLVVAYFVNLPNAFVTYMLKFEQFPEMKR